MLSERELSAAIGSTAYGADGGKIGTVESFFVDDRTGAPSWVAVSTGLFGTRHSIVPALDASFAEGHLRLPVTADAVKSAPRLAGEHLDPAEEDALRRHYGVTRPDPVGEGPVVEEAPAPEAPAAEAPAAEAPAPVAAPADGSMIRSEEQLRVGTERVAATRIRLVKYVVTEDVQITVPVRREEIRVEEVPLDAPDAGPGESLVPDGDTGGGRHHRAIDEGALPDEIILHTEVPVVAIEVVPVERVRLRTELVQDQETVTGQVQRERIVVDQDGVPTAGR